MKICPATKKALFFSQSHELSEYIEPLKSHELNPLLQPLLPQSFYYLKLNLAFVPFYKKGCLQKSGVKWKKLLFLFMFYFLCRSGISS